MPPNLLPFCDIILTSLILVLDLSSCSLHRGRTYGRSYVFFPYQSEYFRSFLFVADRRKVGNEKIGKG